MSTKGHPDLALLHPPSVYDFRRRRDLLFPNMYNTVLNVSPMFEIFPLGFYHIKSYLEARRISVSIHNLAEYMIKDWEFDATEFLRALKPRLFGIDLFWLVHAHGALEICKLIKQLHPDIPVAIGGITASYYFKELVNNKDIDFVIRGNIAFRPLEMLIRKLISGNRDYTDIPNLCFRKDGSAEVRRVGSSSDGGSAPSGAIGSAEARLYAASGAIGSAEARSYAVFNSVKKYDLTRIFPVRPDIKELRDRKVNYVTVNPQLGCRYNCCFCSGSRSAVRKYSLQKQPFAYRQPAEVVAELGSLRSLHKGRRGKKIKLILVNHWHENTQMRRSILKTVKELQMCSNVHVSIFGLMPTRIVKEITACISPVFEISLHSHDMRIRRLCSGAGYTNKEFESWVQRVLRYKVRRIEVYFMIGLPGQTRSSITQTVEYCGFLMRKFKASRRVVPFIGSMVPFLDPGSPAFEHPERFGYRLFYRTLEEHCQALTSVSFTRRLNYETKWLSRAQIVEAVYSAAQQLTREKIRFGYLTPSLGSDIIARLGVTYRTVQALQKIDMLKNELKRTEALKRMGRKVASLNKKLIQERTCDQIPASSLPLYNS